DTPALRYASTSAGAVSIFWPALPVALGIALYLVFRPRPSAALTLGYAVAEGIVLGAFTSTVDQDHPGAALQAVLGTCGVFVAMLVVYRTHALRLTTKRVKWIAAAILGVVLLVVANLIVALGLGYDLGLNDRGVVGVVFSLVCICLASLSFLLSFEAADRLIARGASADWAWYAAFGLCLNLVWLYIELLWARTFFR
ncbi:Bax inhibitor-1/YccA family protein, partial [Streptomyces sp. NPDC003832]